jgi:K+-transporting ATPase ATPase C chain
VPWAYKEEKNAMKTLIRAAAVSLVLLVICGVIYPLVMTGIGQILFPSKVNGSIVYYNGKPAGSELLGQAFTDPRFFHGRVSAVNYNTYTEADTKPDSNGKTAYTGPASGSANLAPSNPALAERVKKDIDEFLAANPGVKREDIPSDLFTSSGSGLDPDISPEAAAIQIPGISRTTGISTADLQSIVSKYTEGRSLGIFGEPRVNVLKVNIEIANRLQL